MDLTKSHDINWRQPCNACGLKNQQTAVFKGHSNCGKVIRGSSN